MIRVEHSKEEFKLFYKNHLFFHHTSKNPSFIIGKGKSKYKLRHDKFKIKETTIEKIELNDFQIESLTENETIVVFKNKNEELKIIFKESDGYLEVIPKVFNQNINRCWILLKANSEEAIYGCGSQFADLDLRGKEIPIWVEDHSPVAKTDYTYFPLPTFISVGKSYYFCHIESSYYSKLNFTNENNHELYVWEVPKKIVIGKLDNALTVVSRLSDYFGRQPSMPEWIYDGLILGIQGGSEVVDHKIKNALDAGIKVNAVWCQDWQGIRMTSFGQQLFWNWEYEKERYPNLPDYIKSLNKKNIKFLAYLNQFLPTDAPLYTEASKKGYCVKDKEGEDLIIYTTDFPTCILDVSNPEAFEWFKTIIKKNLINIGISGWMLDYGEYLPVDTNTKIHSDMSVEEYHNYYPVEFAKVVYQLLKDVQKLNEIFVFNRSGFSHASKYMMCYFSGDQLEDWNEINGIPTVIPCGISIGLCGIGYYCFDIGGYTTYGPYKRTKEMFQRGAEMAAFSMVMRTHEGNRPNDNWQFDSDEETLTHLAKMVRVHVHLKPYLKMLSKEYQETGISPMRACYLHYEDDPELRNLKFQYLFGRDLLVAPVIKSQSLKWKVYLPDDYWIHIWSGKEYGKGWDEVEAPLGKPPVFYRKNSEFSDLFEKVRNL
ncbi:MAG: alpha-glucosidase [Candidatus Hermodarchaeota archaeon]